MLGQLWLHLTEILSEAGAAHLQGFLPQLQRVLCDLVTGHIGGHDEDGILAVDGLSLPVCQPALASSRDGPFSGSMPGQAFEKLVQKGSIS